MSSNETVDYKSRIEILKTVKSHVTIALQTILKECPDLVGDTVLCEIYDSLDAVNASVASPLHDYEHIISRPVGDKYRWEHAPFSLYCRTYSLFDDTDERKAEVSIIADDNIVGRVILDGRKLQIVDIACTPSGVSLDAILSALERIVCCCPTTVAI